MVLVGEYGVAVYDVDYEPQPASQIAQFGFTKGAEFAGSPSEEELSNKLYTGPYSRFSTTSLSIAMRCR